jgi:pseudaminic acid biosynthesis-associated methylase
MIAPGAEMWAGQFGDDYLRRNQVDWPKRRPFWDLMIHKTGARSVFELGANAGWNLSAIRQWHPQTVVIGSDINTEACLQAQAAGLTVVNNLDFTTHVPGRFELVFTSGVLIHIEPEHLAEVMLALVAKSYRWVLAIEYAADTETMVEYRGQRDRLWKRPYGANYEALGLKLVESGDAGPGFDQCTYWLLEK